MRAVKQWLLLLVLSPLYGTPALGETPAKAPSLLSQHLAAPAPALNLRLREDRMIDPSPMQSVIFPETPISANSTLSFGLVRGGPKMPDGRLRGVSRSRSAALRFRMKF
jgi:hypothetical protein